jgi:hypothetical protein
MIDKQTTANLGTRVNFNSGKPACNLGKPTREEKELVVPKPVSDALKPHRMQPGVAEKNLQARPGRRIGLEYGGDILANM